jgi:hypothetical protein
MLKVMEKVETDIHERGWSPVEFGMSAVDREDFARRGHNLIVLAANEAAFADALTFDIDPTLNVGKNNPSGFGISHARNSNDDKIWLHTGYQSFEHMQKSAPGLMATPEVKEYFDAHGDVLEALERSFLSSLRHFSTKPENLKQIFFPDDLNDRLLVLRSVRYLNLDIAPVGKEVIDGHGDMSFASIQFLETHEGYLEGAPMIPEMTRWDTDLTRLDYFQELYARMLPVKYEIENEAAFFLGCGYVGTNHEGISTGMSGGSEELFHAGFRPKLSEPRFESTWLQDNERISEIGFLHPRLSIIRNRNLYRIPDVVACRPLKDVPKPALPRLVLPKH